MTASAVPETPAASWWLRARLVHPVPSLVVAASTAVLATVVAAPPPAGETALLCLSMLCAQFSIGAGNDFVDREVDRGRPDKALATGAAPSELALLLALVFGGAGIALSVPLGAAETGLLCLMLASGQAYNLFFKRTWISWLPFAVALPTLPVWVWTSLDRYGDALLLVYPLGLLFAVALNLANTVPDLDDGGDRDTLAGRLGLDNARQAAMLLAGAGLLLVLGLGLPFEYRWRISGPALGVAAVAYAASGPLLWDAAPRRRQAAFLLLCLTTLGAAVAFLDSV